MSGNSRWNGRTIALLVFLPVAASISLKLTWWWRRTKRSWVGRADHQLQRLFH